MITQEQEHQIETYLRSRKLYHLHLEVKDHFISQISDSMENRGLSFQEALLNVKLDWKKELEMVRADFFSFKRIARIEKEILQKRFRKIIFSSCLGSVLFAVIFFINTELFTALQVVLLGSWIALLGYGFLTKKVAFSHYIAISFHPLIIRNVLLMFVFFLLVRLLPIGSVTMLTDLEINRFFLLYAAMVQLQIIYFKMRRINVLI